MKQNEDEEELQVDAEGSVRNFRSLAIEIGDDLHDDDIEGLKFLSRDFIPGAKLERMKSTQDLFTVWEKNKKFGEQSDFFAECLLVIGRLDLLEELGSDDSEIGAKINCGRSEITEYRRMLYRIGEDLDSEELHKMLYLVGDIKKKEREKITSILSFFAFLEQKKVLDPYHTTKLEDILRTIDRNDLVEIITNYKGKANQSREEGMDTTDNFSQSRFESNQKQIHGTIAEQPFAQNVPGQTRLPPVGQISSMSHGQTSVLAQTGQNSNEMSEVGQISLRTATAGQSPAELQGVSLMRQTSGGHIEQQALQRVGFEDPSRGLTVEHRPVGASLSPSVFEVEPLQQNVIVDSMLKEMSEQVAREVDDRTWLVFGHHLKVTPDLLQRVGRRYPHLGERIYCLLTHWLHSWVGGYDSAITTIINALREVQIHHLADQFSRIYSPQGLSETGEQSLGSRTENISVRTNEAQYQPQVAEQGNGMNVISLNQTLGQPVAVAAPTVEVVEDKVIPMYRMDRRPRGYCLILNIEKFNKNPEDTRARDMPNRDGSSVDAKNLMKTFKELHFIVHLHENLVSTDMVRLMVQTALTVDHSNFDCFVCCILSHGTTGHVYGSDGNLVNISDLTGPLKSVVCPTLAGKPKLFFIQACQGREKQPGFEIEEDGAELAVDGIPREVIPNEADFLMGYATVPGFVSYRSRTHGSWYITKLCDMLNKYGTKYDLLSVLLLVNNEIGRANAMMDGGRYKQSPAPLYTLRKKLIFG